MIRYMVIEWMAKGTAKRIKEADPDKTASLEVLEYGLKIIYNAFAVVSLSFITSLLFGRLLDTIIGIIAFAFLRFFSGGIHIKSSDWCVVISVLIITLIPQMIIFQQFSIAINTITLCAIIFFGSKDIEKYIHIDKRKKYIFKIISFLIVAVNIVLVGNFIISSAFFIQSITLLKLKKRVILK